MESCDKFNRFKWIFSDKALRRIQIYYNSDIICVVFNGFDLSGSTSTLFAVYSYFVVALTFISATLIQHLCNN